MGEDRIPTYLLPQGLDGLEPLRQQAGHDLLVESRKHRAVPLLRQIPSIGSIRAAEDEFAARRMASAR